jgi:hypothetical protein
VISQGKKALIALLGIALGIVSLLAACTPAPPKPLMLVYGDSLTVMSENAARLLYQDRYRLVFRAAGGTSICDWTGGAAADKAFYQPARVVIAFTGNAASCSFADFRSGGVNGLVENYRRALLAMQGVYVGTAITVVGSPAVATQPPGSYYPENGALALNLMYQLVCAEYGMHYDSFADNTLTPGHRFYWQRPAFPGNGPMVTVRAPDGVHVTPAGSLYYAAAFVR